VFVTVACATGVFGWELFASLVLTNYLLKCLVEVVMTPVTYFAVFRLKKIENIDTYDAGVSYSPF